MEIQKFTAPDAREIRTTIIAGDPYFYAIDVANALGYSDTQAMTRRIDEDDIMTCTDNSSGQMRSYALLSEPALYAAILGSSKEEAKAFKAWVTHEVLPAIRKTGAYHAVPQTFAEALQLAADQARTIEAQAAQIEAAKPAVAFLDEYVEAKSTQALSTVAKVLGIKPHAFFQRLDDMGVLFRRDGSWLPYQEHIDAGRFEVKVGTKNGHAWFQAKATPKGVSWLAGRLA